MRLGLGPLRLLLGAPELHRFHHARTLRTRHNFANLAPWLDWVFRTYYRPGPEERFALGLTEPLPHGYGGQLLAPLVALTKRSSSLSLRKPCTRADESTDRTLRT